jgi:transketolase
MALAAAVHQKAAQLGKLAVQMTAEAGSGHPSSGLSLAHIVTYLMYRQMRWDPADPWNAAADRLVLSEGHAVPIIYAALIDLGAAVGRDRSSALRLTPNEVHQLRARDSVLDGHPNPAEGLPFFDAATGSLGQGLSVAAGLALAARLDGSDRRIYVLIGDGESREGQVWEAADFVVDHGLKQVCAVFNSNGLGQAAPVSRQQSAERLVAKLKAFGWKTVEIDGHDPPAIARAFRKVGQSAQPVAIVAHTVKGWGVDELQKGNWHGKPLKTSEIEAADASLDRTVAALAQDGKLPAPPAPPAPGHPKRGDPRGVEWPAFGAAMEAAGLGSKLAKGHVATRRAFGAALRTAGDLIPQIVALDGDVNNSTFTEYFAAAHPERFFEGKIAEQNMVSTAAGLSAAGLIPFVSTFAKFVSRAADQIEMANISRANIKIVGSHAGISLAADGPSQMGLLDVAFFRAFGTVRGDDRERPLCWLFHPADAVAAYHCTRLMVEQPGMCYMRTHRPDVPLIYEPATRFEPGGFHVLSGGDDLAIVTAGFMVHTARAAVALLAQQNVRAALIDAYSLPIAGQRLAEALQRTGGRALVVEDNYGGGLGAAVAEVAARIGTLRVATLCCQRIPKSTRTVEEITEYCGVGAPQIADHAMAIVRWPR